MNSYGGVDFKYSSDGGAANDSGSPNELLNPHRIVYELIIQFSGLRTRLLCTYMYVYDEEVDFSLSGISNRESK